jgi:hypothetical protein
MAVDRWFRFYESAITHDKVRLLPSDTLRWQWVILLSVASKYGGSIPSLKVAAINLNVKEDRAAQVIAALHRAGLLDPIQDGYFKPHDWRERQPTDATAAERKRRQRQRERDDRDSHAVTSVTVTPTEIRDKSKDKEDDDDALARPSKQPWELEPCHDLARQIAEIAGCGDEFEFTGWGGATYRVKQWLEGGWMPELILASVREQAAKKRDGPARSIKYFEPGIAAAVARQNAPLPIAENARSHHGNAKAGSGLAAIDRIFDQIEGRSGAPAVTDENAVLRLPSRSVP